LSVVTYCLIFFPTFGTVTYFAWVYAISSWREWEHLSTSWGPPVYPFKTLMAVGFTLLLLQGISTVLKDIQTIRQGRATS